MLNNKFGRRLVVLLLFVSIAPVLVLNYYWYQMTQTSFEVEDLVLFRNTGYLIAGVAGLFSVVAGIFIGIRLSDRLNHLHYAAQEIGQGHLETRLPENSDDISSAFNAMAANLQGTIQNATAESYKVGLILNNVGEGIVAVDEKGTIIVANISAAVLAGDLPKNIIGKPLKDWFHFKRQGRDFSPDLSEPSIFKDVVLTSLSQREHFVDLLVNPMSNDPTGIKTIFTILDKTSERELENMKVDFVSMAAHELRTPMTAIRGYLDMIARDDTVSLPDQTKGYLQHIQSSSTQLVSLINNLLNASKIERGALNLKLDKIDWSANVRHSIVSHRFNAKAKAIDLTFDAPPRSVFLLGDEVALTEVINNLIGNAINYTPRNGHVFVKITETPKSVVTTISDDGIGISKTGLEKLFTKFYRAHVNGLSSGSGGTGLGLYISKSIVELHKGKIDVKSEENEGTTFTVTLPAFDNEHYDEIMKTRPTNLNKKHGWITKNTPR